MEKQWFEMSAAGLAVDEEAQEAKRLAYAKTFYGDADGREVLFDIRNICYTDRGDRNAMLALIGFYENIRSSCGITEEKEKDVIDAEAEIV